MRGRPSRNAPVPAAGSLLVESFPGDDGLQLGRSVAHGGDPLRGAQRRDSAHPDLARAPGLRFQPRHDVRPALLVPDAGGRVGLRGAEAGQVNQEYGVAVGHPVAGVWCLEGRVVRDDHGPHVEPAAGNVPDRRVTEVVPLVVSVFAVRSRRRQHGDRPGLLARAEQRSREGDAVAHRDGDLLDEDGVRQSGPLKIKGMLVQEVLLPLGRHGRALPPHSGRCRWCGIVSHDVPLWSHGD